MRWALQKVQSQSQQSGYILLVLLLMIAVLTIGFLEATKYDLQYTVLQNKREREEELIHRGAQYSRAIRSYFKKFGRYPARIEDLENTNNIRFLRKRYKDPITGKDFKLLRMNDVQFALNAQIAPNPVRVADKASQDSSAEENAGSQAEDNQDPGASAAADDPPPDDAQPDQSQEAKTNSPDSSGAGTASSATGAQPTTAANSQPVF